MLQSYFLNDFQNADEIWFLNFEIGPVTMMLIGTIAFVFITLGIKYFILFIYNKAKLYGIIRAGATPYNKYFTSVVFLSFFMLSLVAKITQTSFDNPIMMLISTMMVFIFVGFTITSDIKTLQILFVAITGAFMGHIVGAIMIT